jgi:phospholipid/cholesterol/gamma-HCH transport system permease protein
MLYPGTAKAQERATRLELLQRLDALHDNPGVALNILRRESGRAETVTNLLDRELAELVALAGAATGAVLSLQTRNSLTRLGAGSLLPSVIVFSLITEMGPVITGLIVSGRVGAGIGAGLGSMKVTEQIDAMEASAVNPYKFLVLTRVLACVLMLPLLTLAADLFGILGGWAVNALIEPISLRLFIQNGFKTMTFTDFFPPTFKTAIFGFIIGSVASFQGMRTHGGAEGVGRSATSSVVLCSLFIILADVFLVRIIQVLFP